MAAMFLLVWIRPGLFGPDSIAECMFIFYLSFFSLFFLTWMGAAVSFGGENRVAGFLAGLGVFLGLTFFIGGMLKEDPFMKIYLGKGLGLSVPVLFFLAHVFVRLARCVTDPDEPARMLLAGFGQVFLLLLAVFGALLLPWPRLGITPEMDVRGLAMHIKMNNLPPSRWLAPWGVLYFSLLSLGTAVVTRDPVTPLGDPIHRVHTMPFLLCALLSLFECLRRIGAGEAGGGLGGLLALGATAACALAAARAYENQVLAEVLKKEELARSAAPGPVK